MFAYLDILRPFNILMSIIAVLIGWILILGMGYGSILAPQLWISVLAVFLISGAGNVINDYLDLESDKINKPKRPLPSGKMGMKTSLAYALLLFAVGIILAGFVNMVTFAIALLNTIVLIVYSLTLQNKIFLGNLSIAYLVGSTFLFGGAATGSMEFLQLPLILAVLSGLATFSREVIKDLEDIEGDKKNFLKKLQNGVNRIAERFGFSRGGDVKLKYNKERAKAVAAASIILAVFISPIPYLMNLSISYVYLLALIPTNAVFLFAFYMIVKSNGRRNYSRISKTIKVGMFLALIAFFLGAVF